MVLKLDTMISIRHGATFKGVPGDHIECSAVNPGPYADWFEAVPPAVVRRNTLVRHHSTSELRKPVLDALQRPEHTLLLATVVRRPQE